MINELIEALAQGPLVSVDGWMTCAFCGESMWPEPKQTDKDMPHALHCPVNQARLLIAYMEKNMTEVIG